MKKIILGILFVITSIINFSYASCPKGQVELNTDFPWIEGRCIDPEKTTDIFGDMLWKLMKLAINFTIAIAFLSLIWAGIMISTSGVSQNTAGKWKELLKKVIIGIVLLWLSWLILHVINPNFFKTDISYHLIKKINP